MSAAEVEEKFKALFGGYGSLRQAERVIALAEELDRMKDIAEQVRGFARRSSARSRSEELMNHSMNRAGE